ncbi:MAG: bifunctional class I SAM-dependent methyltransferase/glycosyltransferase family 2 protein [Pseudomonadota bacterium]
MHTTLSHQYNRHRREHWDRVSTAKENPLRPGAYYQRLLQRYCRFLVPEGARVLELGCGHGDLLAALKPSLGVGVDFSGNMLSVAAGRHPHLHFVQADAQRIHFKRPFDIIILSDLVNDLWDVQAVLETVRGLTHPGTRIVINFFNNLWRLPLEGVRRLGKGADFLEQNWLSPDDVRNLLKITGFEVVKNVAGVLVPVDLGWIGRVANRFFAPVAPFKWFALANFMAARPVPSEEERKPAGALTVSVIVPARNEAGNIAEIVDRIPEMGAGTEVVFVEGHSQDDTYAAIGSQIDRCPEKHLSRYRQPGKGKGDAVRLGFEKASGDILMILDADMTVPPESLPRFFNVMASGQGEFINGVRLVYPMAQHAMRFANILGNKFFSILFTWLLGQPIKDTLCGTKVLWRADYEKIAANRQYFGDFDPFGDFDLLFGASKQNLKIVEMPIRYQERRYGETNIRRWYHGWILLKMATFAAKRIKFI